MEAGKRTVPDRMLGCWKRKYITFKNGETDISTQVIWLQTLSGMVDIRIPVRTQDFSNKMRLQDYSFDQLLELAKQDCGTAVTSLNETTEPYPTASWDSDENHTAIQTVNNFPEDGWFDWRDDGNCMMEWAPSGAYEEDWRLLADSRTYIAEFKNKNQNRKESIYIAGDHAVFVRAREQLFKEHEPLVDVIRANRDNRSYVEALLDIEFSYALRSRLKNEFVIELSTLPFREKQKLDLGFLLDMDGGQMETRSRETGEVWRCVSQWSNT